MTAGRNNFINVNKKRKLLLIITELNQEHFSARVLYTQDALRKPIKSEHTL